MSISCRLQMITRGDQLQEPGETLRSTGSTDSPLVEHSGPEISCSKTITDSRDHRSTADWIPNKETEGGV